MEAPNHGCSMKSVYALSGSPPQSNAFPVSLVHFSRKPWKPSSSAVQPLVWALFQSHRTSFEIQVLGNFYSARHFHLPPCALDTQSELWGLHHLIWLSAISPQLYGVRLFLNGRWLRATKRATSTYTLAPILQEFINVCYATSLPFEVLTT